MNPSAPPETFSPASPSFLTSHLELRLLAYAAPMARRRWKHSLQKTGRPWVGRKGTVVSFPHCEQLVLVSVRAGAACPPPSALFALHALQRLGSFLNPLSAKNICSPPVNTDRKSTRLNSSHTVISYAVFCLKKKKRQQRTNDTQTRATEMMSDVQ